MLRRRNTIAGWLFLAPIILLFLTFIAFPLLFSGYLSFTRWDFVSGMKGIEWIGLKNFQNLLHDQIFLYALENAVIYILCIVPVSVICSLILAYLLNNKVYIKNILRLFYFIPYISNAVALAMVFKYLFRASGPINLVLANLGVTDLPQWFSNPSLAKIPIITLVIWTSIGYQVLIYMAALQDVPIQLYEAAEIDGASGTQRFFKITIPMISPTTFYLVIIRTIAVFKLFTSVKIMTGTTSERSSTTLVLEIFRQSFDKYNFGYASAMSWVLFMIILIVTLIQMKGQKKWVHYGS